MNQHYILTEEQRTNMIALLDRLPGTRPIANFLEVDLLKQMVQPKTEENPESKKKSELEATKSVESKAKGKK